MMRQSVFLRLFSSDDKAGALAETISKIAKGEGLEHTAYTVAPSLLKEIPGAPFAYWIGEHIRGLFRLLPSLKQSGRHACVTNPAGDDRRYFRCSWEVPARLIGRERRWVPLSKGGEFSPYYSDIHLLVDWDNEEQTYRGFEGTVHRPLKRPASVDYFFRAGLTWPRRTTSGISIRVLPEGCIFADKGPAVFASRNDLKRLLALMNSRVFEGLVALQLGAADVAARSYEVGIIQDTPVPDLSGDTGLRLAELAMCCFETKRYLDCVNEVSHVFVLPALLLAHGETLASRISNWQSQVVKTETRFMEYQSEIDELAFKLYGIEGEDRCAIEGPTNNNVFQLNAKDTDADDADDTDVEQSLDANRIIEDFISYSVGCAFGRWDLRKAGEGWTSQQPADPFAPMQACSPGTLTGDDGLPVYQTLRDYPKVIHSGGILVDDPYHEDDIVNCVSSVIEFLWPQRGDRIEAEICEILGSGGLRDYFHRLGSGTFWTSHVRRYSKSRRKAPIYWLLQSSKRNFALWLYYHRLDKDTLFKALVNYVEPKLRLEGNRLEQLRNQKAAAGTSGREARELERQIDRQDAFISELHDFRDKLRRVAELHLEPDLNDGVVLNIAPLWELVPWSEAKKYWEELLAGKYEWSSIGKQLRAKGMVK